ncbi:hypothetical protein HED60_07640 [Planctomycetales bacterium ZRK34]|nr:hypothetical protein HED60_07640 [Planctomycetales bacterium ZRK34]
MTDQPATQSDQPAAPLHDPDRLLDICDGVTVGIIVLCVIFAYLLPFDYTSESAVYHGLMWFAFFTRTFMLHLGGALLIMAIFALMRKSRASRWLAVSEVVAAMFLLIPTLVQYLPASAPPLTAPSLTLTTANLRGTNATPDEAFKALLALDADLLLLQEYTPAMHVKFGPDLEAKYPYKITEPREGFYGQAVYAKVPLGGVTLTQPPLADDDHPLIRFSILLGADRVTIYNLHLRWQWLGAGRHQFAELMNQLARETSPVILAGDFNMTNTSPQSAALVSAGFRDAADLLGQGLAATWPIHRTAEYFAWPGFRIDHVYLSPELTTADFSLLQTPGSDHRATTVKISFTESLNINPHQAR